MSVGIKIRPVDAAGGKLSDRITTTVSPGSPIVFLGSDNDTIIDPYLGSHVVKIYEKRNTIWAYCMPGAAGDFLLNGTKVVKGGRCKLKGGDNIALRSSDSSGDGDGDYCYKVENWVGAGKAKSVQGEDAGGKATPTAVASAAAASAAASIPKDVGEETMCAICMEIMVKPRTVVPCGHSLCAECLEGQSECAECRGPITSNVICRSLQNLIERLTNLHDSGTKVFDQEDFDSYKSRTKSSGVASAASAPNNSPSSLSSRKRLRQMRRTARTTRRRDPSGASVVVLDD